MAKKKLKKNPKIKLRHLLFGLVTLLIVIGAVFIYTKSKSNTKSSSPIVIDNVLTNPSKYMSQQEKEFQVNNTPPNTELTKDWKEFTSNYYGYSLKYPKDWVFSSSMYEDPYYHTKDEITRLYSTQPLKDTNTYFCLEIRKGPMGATQMSEMAKTPIIADAFTTPSGDQLAIFTISDEKDSMTHSYIKLVENTPQVITYSIKTKRDKEFIEFSGSFNCVGGDTPTLEDIDDNFNTRPEVITAKEILKSINFQR